MYHDHARLEGEERERLYKALDAVKKLEPLLSHLMEIPPEEWTPEMHDIARKVPDVQQVVSYIQNRLGHSLLWNANAYYHHIENLAKEGNEDAMKIYEDLRPAYLASLQGSIDDAAN